MPDEAQGLMLNLGCGARTHRAFVNIDHSYVMLMKGLWFLKPFIKTPIPDSYLHHNLRKGIPFPDGSADVVYSSHVLEHLEPRESLLFMREIYRVLKVNGIIRIVVPDLEISAAAYLEALHRVRSDSGNNHENVDRHEWSTIYLLDQLVRTAPGGYMTQWLREHRNSPVVLDMKGILLEIAQNTPPRSGLVSRIIRLLSSINFRMSGEVHRWMYDDVSLARLFSEAGFRNIRRMSYRESLIPSWESYCLDNNPDSSPHQPDSIWMEGIK